MLQIEQTGQNEKAHIEIKEEKKAKSRDDSQMDFAV